MTGAPPAPPAPPAAPAPPAPSVPPPPRGPRRRAGAILIVLACLAFLGIVCTYGFTNAEDQGLIVDNPSFNPPTLDSLKNLWREPHLYLYIPATYSAWWLLALLGQMRTPDETGATLNPWLFHAFNLALHATAAVLVLNLLRRLIGREVSAVIGALLFALHPIQVEAVAWTTGTKDVLCGAFAFAALLLYVRRLQQPTAARAARVPRVPRAQHAVGAPEAPDLPHAGAERSAYHEHSAAPGRSPREPSPQEALNAEYRVWGPRPSPGVPEEGGISAPSRAGYALATLMLILAMLAKPAAVVVPLMALIIDRMLLKRPWRDAIRSTLPWFVATIPFLIIARLVQPAAEVVPAPLWARPLVAADAIAFYLWKIAWPFNLTIEYARSPQAILDSGAIAWTWVLPVTLAGVLLLSRSRVLIAAGLLFVAGLLPVLGLTTFLFQRFSTVADRFVYLSMFAVALAAAWGVSRAAAAREVAAREVAAREAGASRGVGQAVARATSRAIPIACGVVLALLGVRSTMQALTWRNRVTLYAHAVAVTPHSVVAHNNYGSGLWRAGDLAGAERAFRAALALDPMDAGARGNLNRLLLSQGRPPEPPSSTRGATSRSRR